ncbi:DUF4126 family protein [Dietzia cinnamea]|uniref:DUF4126 family protein n=2 Tax=Dietzia cinnamea TaxID=321318 RepID=UPI0021A3A325|nr:DUF4126 family protein [Dietzia cinnamea]MCT2145742.1 DUF4126 family protein [Dietzia cinnamea]
MNVILTGMGLSAARTVANTGPAGAAAPVPSSVEDVSALGLSLVAISAPIMVLVALLVIFSAIGYAWWALARGPRRGRGRDGGGRSSGHADRGGGAARRATR